MEITVFTASFNREAKLKVLYESLLIQTDKDFEWLIIDDGSIDNTKKLINKFITAKKLNIKYYYKQNGGKHRAINLGLSKAQGELFFIVDSDDFLVENAIEIIKRTYKQIKGNESFAGISGLKVLKDMSPTGGGLLYNQIDANALDIRMKHNVKGDLAEVYRTNILKKYPFPDVNGEKFCAESLVWNRIAKKYKLRYTNQKLYVCEYLDNGLSKSSVKNRINNPIYSTTIYKELYLSEIPFKYKILAGINYWRFAFYTKDDIHSLINEIGWSSIPLIPLGIVFKIIDSI